MTPELHRPVAIDRVGPTGLDVRVQANADECGALARRMNLPAVQSLLCDFHLAWDATGTLLAHGHLMAVVVQTCVVSLDDFAVTVDEDFVVRCVAAGEESEDLDPEALDEISHDAGVLDLGEAAAEQLALALDPYPHAPGATLPEIVDEPVALPFAALNALKRRH